MGIVAASGAVSSLALAVAGGVIAGVACGVAQMNGMAAVQRIAPLHTRGSVVSAYVTLCYVALSLPVIIAGVAADRFGLQVVTVWYFAALTCVVGAALALVQRAPQSEPATSRTVRREPVARTSGAGAVELERSA